MFNNRNDDFSHSAAPKSPVFSIIMPLSWHIHDWLAHLNAIYPDVIKFGHKIKPARHLSCCKGGHIVYLKKDPYLSQVSLVYNSLFSNSHTTQNSKIKRIIHLKKKQKTKCHFLSEVVSKSQNSASSQNKKFRRKFRYAVPLNSLLAFDA